MRLKEWLMTRVNDPTYAKYIWWQDRSRKQIAIHWKHASFSDFLEEDAKLFMEWAKQNNRYRPENGHTPEEVKRWKTNFRCAMASAPSIEEEKSNSSKGKRGYKVYKLLDQPNPHKVEMKKLSNRKAAQSKLKPKEEKRAYNSRLLKVKKECAYQPSSIHKEPVKRQRTASRIQRHQSKVSMTYTPCMHMYSEADLAVGAIIDQRETKVEPTSHYSCTEEEELEEEILPTILDELHEEDVDAGYCSASSATGSLSPGRDANVKEEEKMVLDPVESIFSNSYCKRITPEQYADEVFYIDDAMPGYDLEQETTINEWGQEVTCTLEGVSGANVMVQMLAPNNYEYVRGGNNDDYHLTKL